MPAAASTANRTAQVQSPTGPRSPIKKPRSKDTTRSPEKSKSPARSPAPEPEPESLHAGLLAIRKDSPSYHVHGMLPFATAEEWEKAKAEGAPLYMPEDIKKTMFYAEFYNFQFYTDCVDHEVANKSGEILDLLTKVTYGRAVYYDAETRKAVSLHQGVICCNINIAHTRRGCVNNHWKESNDTYERIITIQNVAECVSEIQRKAKRLVEAEGAQAEAEEEAQAKSRSAASAPGPSELQHVPKLPKIVKLSESQINQLPEWRQKRIREARDSEESIRSAWLRRCAREQESKSRVAWYAGHSDDDVSKQGAIADLADDKSCVDLWYRKLKKAEEDSQEEERAGENALRSAASAPPSPPSLCLPRPQWEDPTEPVSIDVDELHTRRRRGMLTPTTSPCADMFPCKIIEGGGDYELGHFAPDS